MVKHGVTDEQLDREIEQDDFAPVAMHFDDVELYLNPLKLTDNEQADVRRETFVNGNQVAMITCLSIWRGHEPSEATFRALIRMLLDLRKQKIATNICQYLKEKVPGSTRSVQWHITEQPKNVLAKVGEDAKFSIVMSSPGQVSYNWCFNNQRILAFNTDYRGAKTSELLVLKSLSKHCGSYKCIVADTQDVHVHSIPAVLEIGKFIYATNAAIINYCVVMVNYFHTDGTKIEAEESNLLGIILQKVTPLQDEEMDLNIKELLSGTSNLTYEELQIVLGGSASYLSTNLEQKLQTRKQHPAFYNLQVLQVVLSHSSTKCLYHPL